MIVAFPIPLVCADAAPKNDVSQETSCLAADGCFWHTSIDAYHIGVVCFVIRFLWSTQFAKCRSSLQCREGATTERWALRLLRRRDRRARNSLKGLVGRTCRPDRRQPVAVGELTGRGISSFQRAATPDRLCGVSYWPFYIWT